VNKSLQKYYWMSCHYYYSDFKTISACGMAVSKHPILFLYDLNRPPPPSPEPYSYFPSGSYTLHSWQEISLEEYELARQHGMSDAPIEQQKDEPYR